MNIPIVLALIYIWLALEAETKQQKILAIALGLITFTALYGGIELYERHQIRQYKLENPITYIGPIINIELDQTKNKTTITFDKPSIGRGEGQYWTHIIVKINGTDDDPINYRTIWVKGIHNLTQGQRYKVEYNEITHQVIKVEKIESRNLENATQVTFAFSGRSGP